MRKFTRVAGYFLVVCLMVGGCVGRDFPTAAIKEIRPNVTTKDQIFASFGEPAEKGLDTGLETWTYYRYTLGQSMGGKQLRVIFNSDGTVRSYAYSGK